MRNLKIQIVRIETFIKILKDFITLFLHRKYLDQLVLCSFYKVKIQLMKTSAEQEFFGSKKWNLKKIPRLDGNRAVQSCHMQVEM